MGLQLTCLDASSRRVADVADALLLTATAGWRSGGCDVVPAVPGAAAVVEFPRGIAATATSWPAPDEDAHSRVVLATLPECTPDRLLAALAELAAHPVPTPTQVVLRAEIPATEAGGARARLRAALVELDARRGEGPAGAMPSLFTIVTGVSERRQLPPRDVTRALGLFIAVLAANPLFEDAILQGASGAGEPKYGTFGIAAETAGRPGPARLLTTTLALDSELFEVDTVDQPDDREPDCQQLVSMPHWPALRCRYVGGFSLASTACFQALSTSDDSQASDGKADDTAA